MDVLSYLMGRSAGSKNAKTQVVTELPETGEPNVIYLVPKQTAGTDDVFDEYIWVNNDWELIGSTAITARDLPIYILNTTNQLNDNNGTQTLGNDEKTQMSSIITDAYSKEYKSIQIMLCSTTSGKTYMFRSSTIISNTNTSYYFYSDPTFNNQSNKEMIFYRYINVGGSWDNGTFTVSGTFGYDLNNIQYLAKNNWQSYNVDSNYVPAHKKYVDDAITAAIGNALGGSY